MAWASGCHARTIPRHLAGQSMTERLFIVTLYHQATDKHWFCRVQAADEHAARDEAMARFEGTGVVLIEKVEEIE